MQNVQFTFARTKCCDITIRIATFAWITIFLIPKEFAIIRYYLWKIGLYLDWSKLVTSHRFFTGLEHRSVFRARVCVCVCTQTLGCFRDRLLFIRVMEFFLRVVWTLRSFRPLNVSQGNDAEVFFAVCSIFKSWKLFFMFKNCCVTQLTWKIRGKSSR